MTDKYKINLLNYVLNKMEPTSPTTGEIIKEEAYIDRNEWIDFLPTTMYALWFEGLISGNELTTSYSILYGGYTTQPGGEGAKGIIVLVDEQLKPVKTIYNFSSGTPLRYIQCMRQANDGTFYFIDDAVYTRKQGSKSYNSQKRFVMVNNFTLVNPITNDFEVELRKSYAFGSTYQNFYCQDLYKDPNTSHYVMIGRAADSGQSYSYTTTRVIDLRINVGSANTWTQLYGNTLTLLGGSFVLFDASSNVFFRVLVTPTANSNYNIQCVYKNYTGTATTLNIATFSYNPFVDTYNYKDQVVFLSDNKVYFVQNNQRWGNTGVIEEKHIGLYEYDFSTSQLTTVYEKNLGNYDRTNLEAIYITKCDTDIYVQYVTNIDIIPETPTEYNGDFYYQRLVNNIWDPQLIQAQKYFSFDARGITVISKFNLLLIYMWQSNPRVEEKWFQYLLKEDYNSLNYHGEPYVDYNMFIPHTSEIYSNNKLVFARNLYNTTIYNNNTVATIQVPNTYLNDMNLTQQVLFGITNCGLVINNNTIQKNIYEVLLLNFINTINVIDEDEDKLYPNAANYVNANINTGTQANCESTYISKARITKNGTTTIQPIAWQDIDNKHKKIEISLYIDEIITSFELISEDETITYLEKDLSNLEVGNIYTLTQYLRVE